MGLTSNITIPLPELVELSGRSPNEFIDRYGGDAYKFLRNKNPQRVLSYPPRSFDDKLDYIFSAIEEGFVPIEIGQKLQRGYKLRPPTT